MILLAAHLAGIVILCRYVVRVNGVTGGTQEITILNCAVVTPDAVYANVPVKGRFGREALRTREKGREREKEKEGEKEMKKQVQQALSVVIR